MGQRLVIQNNIDGEAVNTIYYHWSAYTLSAIQEVIDLRKGVEKYYEENHNNYTLKDKFNLACLSAVSGIEGGANESIKYIEKLTNQKYTTRADRNEGLIVFDDVKMDSQLGWSEGTIIIEWEFEKNKPNMIDTTFDLYQLVYSETPEEWLDYYDEDEEELESLKENPQNVQLETLSISTAEDVLNEMPYQWYDQDDDRVYYRIE